MEESGTVAIVISSFVVLLCIYLIMSLLCPRREKDSNSGAYIYKDDDIELIETEIPKKLKLSKRQKAGNNLINLQNENPYGSANILPIPPQPIPPQDPVDNMPLQPVPPEYQIAPVVNSEYYQYNPQPVQYNYYSTYPVYANFEPPPPNYMYSQENANRKVKKYKKSKKYTKVYRERYYTGYYYGYHDPYYDYRTTMSLIRLSDEVIAPSLSYSFRNSMKLVKFTAKTSFKVAKKLGKFTVKNTAKLLKLQNDCCSSCLYCKCCNFSEASNCLCNACEDCCKLNTNCCKCICKGCDKACTLNKEICGCLCECTKSCGTCVCESCGKCDCSTCAACLECSGSCIKDVCDCITKSRCCCELIEVCCNEKMCQTLCTCCCQLLGAILK